VLTSASAMLSSGEKSVCLCSRYRRRSAARVAASGVSTIVLLPYDILAGSDGSTQRPSGAAPPHLGPCIYHFRKGQEMPNFPPLKSSALPSLVPATLMITGPDDVLAGGPMATFALPLSFNERML